MFWHKNGLPRGCGKAAKPDFAPLEKDISSKAFAVSFNMGYICFDLLYND